MHLKALVILVCLTYVSADRLLEENDSPANYEFSYSVNDVETGDVKAHQESRDGDNVQGQYSLNDADGYKRIVDYTVNGESGFQAVVRREPLTEDAVNFKQSIAPPKPAVAVVIPKAPAQQLVQKLIVQPAAGYLRTTLVHHHQPHTVYHAAPVVHLGHSAHHIVHSAPTATFLKSAPAALITTTHHSPAIVHHAPAALVHHHAPSAYVHYH